MPLYNPDTWPALALAPRANERAGDGAGEPHRLERDRAHTLGEWGSMVTVQSEPNQDTTITMRLPRHRGDQNVERRAV